MANEAPWPEIKLGDVADEITVGWVGPMTQEYRDSGVPFLRSLNVKPFRIQRADLRYISAAFHAKIEKSRLKPGDVVIVRTGVPGTAAVIPEWLADANCADLVVVRPGNRLDPRFLAYFVNAAAHHQISANIVGAVQQHFNVGSAKELRILVPEILEQRAIARVLSTMDDKIESNRRMNHTLEALARALFQSWFVDFDPVTAKAASRRPVGMTNETAELFPDGFEDSPIGPIPKGWKVGRVGDEYRITMGQSPPGSTYNETGDGLAFFQGRTDFGFRFPSRRIYCTAPTRFANTGDTLVSVRAPVGDINMAWERCAIGRGLSAVRHESGSTSYTYHAMNSLRDEFNNFEGNGTLFGCIGRTDFEGIKQVQPPQRVILAYDQLSKPLDDRILANEQQTRALGALRDALLPRLLSGELRVKDAENLVKTA